MKILVIDAPSALTTLFSHSISRPKNLRAAVETSPSLISMTGGFVFSGVMPKSLAVGGTEDFFGQTEIVPVVSATANWTSARSNICCARKDAMRSSVVKRSSRITFWSILPSDIISFDEPLTVRRIRRDLSERYDTKTSMLTSVKTERCPLSWVC